MTEPWASDFRALREHSRQDAPSPERTRQFVLASAMNPEPPQEKTMTFLKRRPALAVAIALALIAVLTPVAYAVVNKVFLTIDPDQSEEEIERNVEQQLESAGVSDPRVTAQKDGDRLEIGIRTEQPDGDMPEIDVSMVGKGKADETTTRSQVKIAVECELTPEQVDALTDLVGSHEFYSLMHERPDGQTDEQLAAAMRDVLARHGFKDTEVTVGSGQVSVTIESPPT
jgi:hypothetical protein